MTKTTKYWDKRAIKRLSENEKQSEEYIKRIKRMYDQAFKNIDKEIKNVYKNYSKDTGLDVQKLKELLSTSETSKTWKTLKRQGLDKYVKENYKSRISRLEKIQAQIYAEAKKIYPKEELENKMCYKGVINNSYYKAVYDTQMGTGYDFSFSKIDNNVVNALLNEKWSGKNYSQRIWGNTDILAKSLSDIVGGAMLSGQGISKTSKQVRDKFNTSKYYAERLVRTETNHFNNEADAMAYEDMGIDKYVFVATLDSRTSPMCQDMDGEVFKYKEREVGVNYPPLHPNCRSKTRGYLGEEAEKTLQRRARNPITGKNEVIDNMTYKEWAKKNGLDVSKKKRDVQLPAKQVVNASKSVKNEPKTTKTWLKPKDVPTWYLGYNDKTNKLDKVTDEANVMVDYLNKNGNPNSKASKVFKTLTDRKNTNFVFTNYKEGKGHFTVERRFNSGEYQTSITAPKLSDKTNPLGSINTTLHENWHAIDFVKAGNNNTDFVSINDKVLRDAVINYNGKMGEPITNLFTEYNKKCTDIHNNISEANSHRFTELTNKYNNGGFKSYNAYSRAWNKLNRELNVSIDIEKRNAMGGGVDLLQDIYDALSNGYYRDAKIVKYGHGSKYFKKGGMYNQAIKEIVADYGALSMTNPKLVKMLKTDQPELVKALEGYMDTLM